MPIAIAAIVAGAGLVGGAIQADAARSAANKQAGAAGAATATQLQMFEQEQAQLAPWRDVGEQGLNLLANYLGLPGTGGAGGMGTAPSAGTPPNPQDFYINQPTRSAGISIPSPMGPAYSGTYIRPSGASAQRVFNQAGYDAAMAKYKQDQAATQTASASQDPRYGSLLKPFTGADLENYPGYKFAKEQGTEAVMSSAAAGALPGGLLSGATLKELDRFGTGLASETYGQAFQQDSQQKQLIGNLLAGVSGTGQSAVNTGVAAGQNTASNIGSNIIGAGNAQAAGTIGVGNAINSAIGTGTNAYLQYNLLNSILGGGGGQSSGGSYPNMGPTGGNAGYSYGPTDTGLGF